MQWNILAITFFHCWRMSQTVQAAHVNRPQDRAQWAGVNAGLRSVHQSTMLRLNWQNSVNMHIGEEGTQKKCPPPPPPRSIPDSHCWAALQETAKHKNPKCLNLPWFKLDGGLSSHFSLQHLAQHLFIWDSDTSVTSSGSDYHKCITLNNNQFIICNSILCLKSTTMHAFHHNGYIIANSVHLCYCINYLNNHGNSCSLVKRDTQVRSE